MTAEQRTSYQDIKSRVLAAIRDNTWPPGAVLPGEVELAETYGCARTTVNRAMRELAEEGIIERKRKAGTRVRMSPTRQAKFVIPVVREEIEQQGAAYRYALVSRAEIDAPTWLAAKYALRPGARVIHLVCMHYANSDPYQYEERWINLDAVPQARDTDFSEIGPNEWLVREVPFTEAELAFSAVGATRDIAEFLGTQENSALFCIERTTWLQHRNVTFARLLFRPGHQMKAVL